MEHSLVGFSSVISEYCHYMGIEETYSIVPMEGVSVEQITNYWKELQDYGQLAKRWGDLAFPSVKDIVDISLRKDPTYQMFAVIYCDDGHMVAEFSLEHFTGRAAQVHFSMRQELDTPVKYALADQVTDMVLEDWTDINSPDRPYLDTIFGLTPTIHRLACMFVLRSGFKKVGILPRGVHYMGQVSDAMLTIKTRGH